MTNNCKIELLGCIEKTPKLVTKKDLTFLVLTVATRDDYLDESTGKQKEKTLWHQVFVYNKDLIETVKPYQKGEKIHLLGTLSYRPIETPEGYKKPQASIVALGVKASK